MEVCTYQSVACSTTMWGGEEDSLLFIYMRVALGNGRTDASSVVYMYGGLQASYLVPEMGNLPTDIHTYMDLGLAGRKRANERERQTVHMHLRTRRSFQPLIHSQTPLPRLNVASSKLFFPYHYPRIVSYLSSGDGDKSEGRSGKKYIDIVSDRELQTPSQACRKNWEMWEMWKWHGRILQDSYRL